MVEQAVTDGKSSLIVIVNVGYCAGRWLGRVLAAIISL